jgi:hypothetical protein
MFLDFVNRAVTGVGYSLAQIVWYNDSLVAQKTTNFGKLPLASVFQGANHS